MTKSELFGLWARYMQRKDMTGDMEQTLLNAQAMVKGQLLWSAVDLDKILADNGEILLHAGLVDLATIAKDDEDKGRAEYDFAKACGHYSRRRSIDAGAATASSPYLI